MLTKNYNSNRAKLLLPEYGRNILQMIEILRNIPDREERNIQAKIVIDVMGNINPTLRDSSDYKHKLWDHLFIIADFDLDIDSPYPIPDRNALSAQPQRLKYSQHSFTHKQYGNNIRKVINQLSEIEDKELRDGYTSDIAKFMKYKSYEFNQEFPSDEVILNDIRDFTDNEFDIADTMLDGTKIFYNNNRNQKNGQKNGTPQKKNNGGKKYEMRTPGKKHRK